MHQQGRLKFKVGSINLLPKDPPGLCEPRLFLAQKGFDFI